MIIIMFYFWDSARMHAVCMIMTCDEGAEEEKALTCTWQRVQEIMKCAFWVIFS